MAGAGYKLFNTGDVLTAQQVNEYLMQQTVMVFADASARTTALSGVLAEGMVSYLQDTNVVEIYTGAAWVSLDDPNAIQNSIVTTKGDLIVATANATPARLASSASNNQVLTVDTSTSTGLKYANEATATLTTTGDLLYASGANTLARLGIGSSSQVLTVSGGLPSWATPSSGGMTLLSTTSFSSTSTTISSINQNYINLVIIIEGWYKSGSGDNPVMQWNGLTGASYGGTRITSGAVAGFSSQSYCVLSPNNLDTSNKGSNMMITFPNYAQSVNQIPTWMVNTSPNANYSVFGQGQYLVDGSAGALTSLTFRTSTLSNNNNGTIKIYGVK